MTYFNLKTEAHPTGDQPEAIRQLTKGFEKEYSSQVLLGVTGSGKTFTMANVIQNIQRPTLVISHNKTLAAQLFSEFKSYFPDNAVEYFISYYDYYLPESYIPQTDTYIAKDASINEEIERHRLSASASLMSRRDVIIVASVSCIYGLGSPQDFADMSIKIDENSNIEREELLRELVKIQYERNDTAPDEGQFRVRGDTVDVYLSYKKEFVRIEFWGDEIEEIKIFDAITEKNIDTVNSVFIPPAKHFVVPPDRFSKIENDIHKEMEEQVKFFEKNNRLVEAQRIYQRTTYDLEMLKEIGYCSGIENYARYLSGRAAGSRPYCLLDYLPDDFVLFIDESHVTIPQLRAMYNADRSRKETLVEHGFRLPSALDNRPLSFDEFNNVTKETCYVSATPGDYELNRSSQVVEQVVRPTGLLDPEIEVRSLDTQIDDIIKEIKQRVEEEERVLVTTLTKKSSERLADYLSDIGIKAKYLHSEIDAIQRVKILTDLRKAEFHCLIGVNLLREGLDLPEVALVGILDADKEGFLRSERSLIQVAGRAARNVKGKVILYANKITPSIRKIIDITNKRREKQKAYNEKYGITPETIQKQIKEDIAGYRERKGENEGYSVDVDSKNKDVSQIINSLEKEMMEASESLEFERAAYIRDTINKIKDGKELDEIFKNE